MKGTIITLIVFLTVAILVGVMYVNRSNKEIRLRAQVVAQEDVARVNYDNMYKKIAQIAQVPQQFMETAKEAFKEIYIPLMTERYDGDRAGALMSWIQESNPNFDLSAMSGQWEQIQLVIESSRDTYTLEQKKLVDLNREHSVYISTFPNTLFLSNREPIDIRLVTSTQTEEVYRTGTDDNVELFK